MPSLFSIPVTDKPQRPEFRVFNADFDMALIRHDLFFKLIDFRAKDNCHVS